MEHAYDLHDVSWKPMERDETRGVEGHVLVPADAGRTQVGVTRIADGGAYELHVDEYAQVFVVLEGRGEAEVAGQRVPLQPGVILRTRVGEAHGLWASAGVELVVLTVNTYPPG